MKRLEFEGTGREYFKIWIVNVLLTIVTLGVYYPWAKVRNRRYLYGNTTLEGRNFDYHATGKQLLLGYLISVGFFIVYTLLGQVSPIAGLLLILVLFLAIPWLIVRSMGFNLRMTSFSNVRFSFHGKMLQAYINFFFYPLILIVFMYGLPIALVLLGNALSTGGSLAAYWQPWMGLIIGLFVFAFVLAIIYYLAFLKRKNTSYYLEGMQYGEGKFSTLLESNQFFIISMKTIVVAIFVSLVMNALIGFLIYNSIGQEGLMELINSIRQQEKLDPVMIKTLLPVGIISYLIMLIGITLISSYAVARQRKYIFENTRLDRKISFESSLRARSLSWVHLTNLFLILLTLGLAYPWIKIRMIRLTVENTLVDTSKDFEKYMTQKVEEQSSLGEQIGDAFDVDVGIGI